MNLQYISDNKGQTAGVFIPIQDWNELKLKYKDIENTEENSVNIPNWHKAIIDNRLETYKDNPSAVIDFDRACEDIEKEI